MNISTTMMIPISRKKRQAQKAIKQAQNPVTFDSSDSTIPASKGRWGLWRRFSNRKNDDDSNNGTVTSGSDDASFCSSEPQRETVVHFQAEPDRFEYQKVQASASGDVWWSSSEIKSFRDRASREAAECKGTKMDYIRALEFLYESSEDQEAFSTNGDVDVANALQVLVETPNARGLEQRGMTINSFKEKYRHKKKVLKSQPTTAEELRETSLAHSRVAVTVALYFAKVDAEPAEYAQEACR